MSRPLTVERLWNWRSDDLDVVVSDVVMPVLNGIELCRQLKENPERLSSMLLLADFEQPPITIWKV